MPGKNLLLLGLLLGLFGATGCCRMCDRWCGSHHHAGAVPVYTAAPPAGGCMPCAPVPTPVCCPTPVSSSPVSGGGGWQRCP
jgi:hypothetical protein